MRYESYPTGERYDFDSHGIIACYTVGHVIRMLSHQWKSYPMDENIYDIYLSGIIGCYIRGHVIIGVIPSMAM